MAVPRAYAREHTRLTGRRTHLADQIRGHSMLLSRVATRLSGWSGSNSCAAFWELRSLTPLDGPPCAVFLQCPDWLAIRFILVEIAANSDMGDT
jgi:hypothetical protein